jgi:hypothetical protein
VGQFVAQQRDRTKNPMFINRINVSIDSIEGGKIRGHSVVAGNYRPFAGTISKKGALYSIVAQEPGDDQYDGFFEFTLDPKAHRVKGLWTANDKKLAVTTRHYELTKTSFHYNPQQNLDERYFTLRDRMVYDTYNRGTGKGESFTKDASKFNASSTLLSSRDVENMYKRDLEVTRNAIYARHGYSFQNRDMRNFFDSVEWYIPVSVDVTKELTDIEKKNIELLKRYEKHAAAYYDRFGR